MIKYMATITITCLVFSGLAQAQTLDGYIKATTIEQVTVLKNFVGSQEPLSQYDCGRLALSITRDVKVTAAERDMAREFMRTDVQTISAKDGDKLYQLPTASPVGAKILGYIIADKKIDAAALWKNGPQDLADLGIHYHVYPATQSRIIKGIVKDIVAADKASSAGNAYGPLRTFLANIKADIDKFPEYEKALTSEMMYNIMEKLDARKGESANIPNYVYSHFHRRKYEDLLP